MAAWLNTLRLSPARPSGSLLLVASVVHEQLPAGDVGSGASSHWRRGATRHAGLLPEQTQRHAAAAQLGVDTVPVRQPA